MFRYDKSKGFQFHDEDGSCQPKRRITLGLEKFTEIIKPEELQFTLLKRPFTPRIIFRQNISQFKITA